MTARRRLVPESEVASMAETLRRLGFKLDGPVDIRADGVTFHPAAESGGDAYEKWARKNPDRD